MCIMLSFSPLICKTQNMASRTKKSALNSIVGILFAIVSSLLTFTLNAVFIRLLGLEYAGVNGLFSSILQLLNIADLGISNAILFRLYKRIASNDDEGICLMLTTYKRICYAVAACILVGGLCCMPFLEGLVKEKPSFPEPLWTLFVFVLSGSVISHAFDYTRLMLTAKQDQYLATIIKYLSHYLTSGVQLLLLFLYKDIYLYLSVSLFVTCLQLIIYATVTRKKYKARWNSKRHVDSVERKKLIKDTGSLAVYKFCRTLDATIDTLLISKFVAIATTAIYGSVNIIVSFLQECFGNLNDGMLASIGDLNARGNGRDVSSVFYQSMHMTYLVFGVITVGLVPLLSTFVQWWIGHTLSDACIYVILLNFYMGVFGNHVAVFRNSLGIFIKGWKRPIFTALLNLVFSLALVIKFGLIGTLLGTTIARVLTLHWYDPWLVCKEGFGEKPIKYYAYFVVYILVACGISIMALWLNNHLPIVDGLTDVVWHGVVISVFGAILFVLVGMCFPEQKALFKRLYSIIKR